MDDQTQSKNKKNDDEEVEEQLQDDNPPVAGADGGNWGGWGFSPLSILSDLQKAAAVAAEEISRNVRFEIYDAVLFICSMHSFRSMNFPF